MRCLRETLLASPARYLENVYSIGHKEKLSACHPRRKIWARSRLRIYGTGRKTHNEGISSTRKKRGAIEGPIRIPLDSLSFLFNALALLDVSSKSLKFQAVLFSIPTAPTNLTD